MPFLYTLVILLAAAVVAVPVAKRLGFGSILGYLGAGLIIGPAGLRLVTDVESIAQASELGVVMLLFLIGLELRPARLWVMRRSVLGLGTAQVAVTAAVLALCGHMFGLAWSTAVVVGFGLALSSTAFVLPMLAERELLATRAGRDAFSVLLFQDLAVIPAVALLPLFDGGISGVSEMAPGQVWLAVAKGIAAVLVVLIGGRFLIRPIFRAVEGAKAPEIFTATALVIVMGTAALVSLVGLSMSLGAFMAGVLLSESEYRHELQADIEPFEGLLLGVFFISVGMSADLALLVERPGLILGGVALLLAIKTVIAFALGRASRQSTGDATRFALALAQAGEFGFVLFGAAVTAHVKTAEQSQAAMLVVTLSMVASPLLFALEERWLAPRLDRRPHPSSAPHTLYRARQPRRTDRPGSPLRQQGLLRRSDAPRRAPLGRRRGGQGHRHRARGCRRFAQGGGARQAAFSQPRHRRARPQSAARASADGSRRHPYRPRDLLFEPAPDRTGAGGARHRARGCEAHDRRVRGA